MIRQIALTAILLAAQISAQSPPPISEAFEVATIKPVDPQAQAGRYITMQGDHRFIARYYTVKLLLAAAYDLTPQAISGGPEWLGADHFDITALTPGATRPSRDQQMAMLRTLLADRFKLTFHREEKEFSIYNLTIDKNGPKLKPSTASPDDPAELVSTVYPERVLLPARNATMREFASLMQRAALDRPVVDKTGLTAKYDFDLTWSPDETQFGGELPVAPPDAAAPPFFIALQKQLGLKLEPSKGPVQTIVVDSVARPSEN
jgi:uncharacterized protein (TIGR03435 family)